jgi:CheY-like chemotaxis protein
MRALANCCILVLAFDAVHATGVVALLEGAGADTVIAANAREALQRIEQFTSTRPWWIARLARIAWRRGWVKSGFHFACAIAGPTNSSGSHPW